MTKSIAIDPSPTQWHGTLQLEFSHDSHGTHLSHRSMQAPLKVQRPFYPEGAEVCHLVTLHTAGGVVGGDRLSLDITLHPQTHALMTTAAAGKIYRSNGQTADQTIHLKVAKGACLEWLPQEAIVFNGAHYQQEVRVDLAEDALWMGWELTRLGRTARGEQFSTGLWRSRTQVWQHDRPLWIDPQRIEGGSDVLTSLHGLAGCSVIGSFAVIGRSLSPSLVEKARLLWQPLPDSPAPIASEPTLNSQHSTPDTSIPDTSTSDTNTIDRVSPMQHSLTPAQTGVTRLMSGLLCRYRGHSTLEARRWFTQVWHLLRLELCDRPSCPPRVW